jgi:hypothetical protein
MMLRFKYQLPQRTQVFKFTEPINAVTTYGAIRPAACEELKVYSEHPKAATEALTK